MADQKISELTALSGASVADDDAFAIVDTSQTETKKITKAELAAAIGNGDFTFTGASYNAVWDQSDNALEFADNAKASFGGALTISHDGTNSKILNYAGDLIFQHAASDHIIFQDAFGNKTASFLDNGAVELYNNAVKVFETKSSGISIIGGVTETEYSISFTSSGGGYTHTLDASNGAIQYGTLAGATTFSESLSNGQSILLMIDDGTAYTITWPTMTWLNNAGSAPTLAASGYTAVVIWQTNNVVYGVLVGDGT
jgi:hypothetical protein